MVLKEGCCAPATWATCVDGYLYLTGRLSDMIKRRVIGSARRD